MSKKHYPYMDKNNDCCFSRCLTCQWCIECPFRYVLHILMGINFMYAWSGKECREFARCLKDKVRSEKLWNLFREFLKLSNYANYDIGDYRE